MNIGHTTRTALEKLVQRGELQPEQLPRAATAAQLYPDSQDWHRFLNQVLLWLGALALGFSLLFFIAYNWAAMARMGRFALVEAALVASLAIYVWKNGLVAQAALVVSALLVGVLLALFGQVYQTGADPWQLFFTWALMLLPWAALGRTPVLWLMITGLLNVALMLYDQTFHSLFFFDHRLELSWALVLLNGLALLAWEALAPRFCWLNVAWAQALLGLAATFSLTLLATDAIGIRIGPHNLVAIMVYLLLLGAGYWWYRLRHPNLFMLAAGCLSLIWLVIYFVVSRFNSNFADVLLLLALLVLGLSTAATLWLKRLHREIHHHD